MIVLFASRNLSILTWYSLRVIKDLIEVIKELTEVIWKLTDVINDLTDMVKK